jgi:hypothetical protein
MSVNSASGGSNSFLQAYQTQIDALEADPNATSAYKQGLEQQLASVWQAVTGSAPPADGSASSGGPQPGQPNSPPPANGSDSSGSPQAGQPNPPPPANAGPASSAGPDSSSGTNPTPGPGPADSGSPVGGGSGPLADFSTQPQSSPNSPQQTQAMANNLVNTLMSQEGLSKNQAVGVVASMMEESGLNTGIEQGGSYTANPTMQGDTVNQTGYGLAQWGEGRKQDLLNYASQNNLPPSSQAAQVGFMLQELNGPYSSVIQNIKNGPDDANSACLAWTTGYEQASDPNMSGRLQNIAQVENWLVA